MKIKPFLHFCVFVFFVTGILQISSIRSFAQQSVNSNELALGVPSTNEIGPYEIGTGLVTASGVIVNQAINTGCGFNSNSPYTACGVSVKGENYWLGLGGSSGLLRHSFSSTVNNIEYNIINMNQGEVITVTVSNGTPTITASSGCYYDINGNILSGTRLSGDTGVKIKITSTEPYSWVNLSHGGGGFGCSVPLDGNSVVAYTATTVPFSKWATIFGFSLIFLLTIIRFKRIL
jgi:hypothetical protein